MNVMSSERALEEFLQSRNPNTISKERAYVPVAAVHDRLYDDITAAILSAMSDGTYLRLRLAVEAAFTNVTAGAVRWARSDDAYKSGYRAPRYGKAAAS